MREREEREREERERGETESDARVFVCQGKESDESLRRTNIGMWKKKERKKKQMSFLGSRIASSLSPGSFVLRRMWPRSNEGKKCG